VDVTFRSCNPGPSPISLMKVTPAALTWWARQDSNLQPDRYERSALTVELQAPEPA
jgi:hypothetical protein